MNIKRKDQLKGIFALVIASLIWGTAFAAQQVGMNHVGPFSFNGGRSLIAFIVLLPLAILSGKFKVKSEKKSRKTLWKVGVICGILLFVASSLQQNGLKYSTVGKAGFLTALYIVIVPVLGSLFGRKASAAVWVGVLIALAGTYIMSVGSSMNLELGDLLLIAGALFYSIHILVVDRYIADINGIQLSCIQMLVCGILSMTVALITEQPEIQDMLSAWLPLLYAGVLSSGVAYTLQIVGQRYVNPAVAPIIMSLESVFALLTGWLYLKQALSIEELIGCGLVFIAVILAQLPEKAKK